ncbi:MDR family MFS transporter [Ectobacillus sp. sgz5001026]|uniref:MDR family MFS transporter n=1 Tax=Ectobacillus sp. sgz5001026 TaxID=3242473 RepID=UPI0036D3F47A
MKWKEWNLNLKIRLIGESLYGLFYWMLLPFMAIYFSDSFGKEMAGYLLIASQFLSVLATLFGGYLADTYGRKRMMVISTFVQSFAFILFTFANSSILESPLLTFIAFSLLGIMGSLYYPASAAMVSDTVQEDKQSNVFAVFYTAININVVAGPIIGAYFFFTHRFELLLVSTIVNVMLAFVFQIFIRETLPIHTGVDNKSWITVLKEQVSNYKVIFQDRIFFIFILSGIFIAQTYTQIDLLLAVYIKEIIHGQVFFHFFITGESLFSWIIAENGLLVALFTVAVTKLSNRFSEKTIFILSSILYGISMLVFDNVPSVIGMIVAMAIFTLGEIVVVGIQNSFVSKIAPENMRAQYFATSMLRWSIGRTVAPIAIPVSQWLGYSLTFILIAILALVSACLYWIMFTVMEKEKTSCQM